MSASLVDPLTGPFFFDAEMVANLTAVDLGPGRTAVSIAAGYAHTCVIQVRSGGGCTRSLLISRLGLISDAQRGFG